MNQREIYIPANFEARTLGFLRGRISDPVGTVSQKPGYKGQAVTVRVVEEGVGMVGLEDSRDNREWSGMFNHLVTTARVATFLAEELQKTGVDIDPRVVQNAVFSSHAGRRQWDEACWYPDVVENALVKKEKGDVRLTQDIIGKSDLSQSVKTVVKAHGIPTIVPLKEIDTWEKKVALYVDYRVTQGVMSFDERVAEFAGRAIQERRMAEKDVADLMEWGHRTEQEIFSRLSIKPEDITNDFPPKPWWERYIRRLYIHDAEEGIFEKLSMLYAQLAKEEIDNQFIEKEFPSNTWWGKYARELYDTQKGLVYGPNHAIDPNKKGKIIRTTYKKAGIARAIEFYSWLETTSLDGYAENLPRRPIV